MDTDFNVEIVETDDTHEYYWRVTSSDNGEPVAWTGETHPDREHVEYMVNRLFLDRTTTFKMVDAS